MFLVCAFYEAAEKYAMLFVCADFICVTRHCRSCCSYACSLLPTHTFSLCPTPRYPSLYSFLSCCCACRSPFVIVCLASRRLASFWLRDNKHHKSFFLPNGTPPRHTQHLPTPPHSLCLSFRAAPCSHFVGVVRQAAAAAEAAGSVCFAFVCVCVSPCPSFVIVCGLLAALCPGRIALRSDIYQLALSLCPPAAWGHPPRRQC